MSNRFTVYESTYNVTQGVTGGSKSGWPPKQDQKRNEIKVNFIKILEKWRQRGDLVETYKILTGKESQPGLFVLFLHIGQENVRHEGTQVKTLHQQK